MTGQGHNSENAPLRAFVERIEKLEEEKRAIADDIKEVYAEAKGTGFDTKTMRQIVKLRKMTEGERADQDALLDMYKAALNMLGGTPLGEAALRRLSKKPHPLEGEKPSPESDHVMPPDDTTVSDAKRMGGDAAKSGLPVTGNPFTARDPRRASWDEGWCGATGSDGMDIPDAWRRKSKKEESKGGDEK